MSGPVEHILTFPIRRPWTVLGAAAALTAASVVGVVRLPINASLDAMLDRRQPAVAALSTIIEDFDVAGDLIVLAALPEGFSGGTDEGVAGLIAFGQRLEGAVRADERLAAMCPRVVRGVGGDAAEFVRREMIPAGAHYLDDAGFAALRRRLTRAEMSEQLRRNETLIAAPGPAGAALSKALLGDPLRLREFVTERLSAARSGFRTFGDGPDLISADGRHAMILLRGARPSSDLKFSRTFAAAAKSAAESVNADGLVLDYTGGFAIAAESERRIRSDSISNVFSSLLLMQVLFWIAYRRFWSFGLAAVPLIVGIVWGFGAYSLLSSGLTPLTAVIGGVLAGLGDDYAIHWLSRFQSERAAGADPDEAASRTVRALTPAMLSAWGTSAVGFGVIALSGVQALRDFALIGALGLTGAFLAALFVGPALLKLTLGRLGAAAVFERRLGLEPVAGFVERRRRPLTISLTITFAALTATPFLLLDRATAFEGDLTVLHPEPNAPLAAQRRMAAIFGGSPDALMIHLRADSAEALSIVAHQVANRLDSPAVRAAGVVAAVGPALFTPDPERVARRRAQLRSFDIEAAIGDFRSALAESPFEPAAYQGYEKFLRRLFADDPPPALVDLARYPRVSDRLLPRSAFGPGAAPPTQALVPLLLDAPLHERDKRDAVIGAVRSALGDVPGAVLTGVGVIAADTEAAVRRDLLTLLLAAAGVNLIWLAVHMRRAADTALAVLPTAFALAAVWSALSLLGERWNLANLMVLPLLIGAGVDYGIFAVCLFRDSGGRTPAELRRDVAAAIHALATTNATTVIGFGTLVFTSTPAVRSFGLLTAIGLAACLAATVLLTLPILVSRDGRFPSDRERTPGSE